MKKVLFVASECVPFIKTGGLADVVGSLPKYFDKSKYDVRVMIPKYTAIPEEYKNQMHYITHFYLELAWRKQYVGVFEMELNGVKFYFLDNEFYFSGSKPYGEIYQDIEKFAKANKLTIIDVISQDSPYYNIGPSEFLFLERNAEVIITDSFHACVFAILNERPFVVVERKEKNFQSMGSRIDTLLDKFHLENRRYDAGSLDETAGTPINYTRVNEILEIERNDSIQYLKKYIGEN